MFTRNLIFVVFIFLSGCSISQTNDSEFYYYTYPNGNLKTQVLERDSFIILTQYYQTGELKDSSKLVDGNYSRQERDNNIFYNGDLSSFLYTGVRKRFFRNGAIRFIMQYGKETPRGNFKIERFRKDQTIAARAEIREGMSFGKTKRYNRKGEVVMQFDYNKGRDVRLPKNFRRNRYLKNTAFLSRMEYKKAFLTKGNKKDKIKTGAVISISFKGDALLRDHFQVHGFGRDSIFLSKFSYNFDLESKQTLNYDSSYAVGFDQIESIHFGRNNQSMAEFGAMVPYITGVVWFTEGLIVFPLIYGFSLFSEPVTWFFVGISPPLFYWGKYLLKKLVPREYKMNEWKWQVRSQ